MKKAPAVLGFSLALLALPSWLPAVEHPFFFLAQGPAREAWNQETQPPDDPSYVAAKTLFGLLPEALEEEKVRVALVGPMEQGPSFEAVDMFVDRNPTAFLVGVRATAAQAHCVAVHVPSPPPDGDASDTRGADELYQAIQQADAAERIDASERMADYVAAALPTCRGEPDEVIEYFLSLSGGPAVLIELRPAEGPWTAAEDARDSARLLHKVAGAMARFLADSSADWSHPIERFD